MLTQEVKDLQISADRFTAQIPTLKDKAKHLEKMWWMGWMRSAPENSAWSAPLKQTRIIRNITFS
jgi:hypothetical protein